MIVNMTPHEIVVLGEDASVLAKLPPSGNVARCAVKAHRTADVDGIPVYVRTFGEPQGLPEPQEGVYFLVSSIVLEAGKALGRADLLAPGELVRGPDGQPVGCRGLSR